MPSEQNLRLNKNPPSDKKCRLKRFGFQTAFCRVRRRCGLFHFAFQRAVACRIHLFQRDEFQARAVDAVAQSAFVLRTVGEDVSQVRIGGMAAHFGAAHVVAEIVVFGNGGGINRVGEARPAAAGIEFVGRAEQGFAADDVHINAGFEQVVVFVAEGVFGRAVLGNLVLLFGQETFEFGSTGFFIRAASNLCLEGRLWFARQRFVGFADVDVAVAVGVF